MYGLKGSGRANAGMPDASKVLRVVARSNLIIQMMPQADLSSTL